MVANTTGLMFRKMSVGGKEVVLGVWDTAGSERYESMARMYYRRVPSIAPYCVTVLLCYGDVSVINQFIS